MEELRAVLERIDSKWRALGATVGLAARPGLSEEAIRSVLGEIGLEATPEVLTWFGWHDGVDVESSWSRDVRDVGDGFFLISLAEAVDKTLSLRRLAEAEFPSDPDSCWPRSWLLIQWGGGADLAVETGQAGPGPGVFLCGRDSLPAEATRFENLIAWARHIEQRLDTGPIAWSSTGNGLDGHWERSITRP